MSFKHVKLLSLSEQIAGHIKQSILDGELAPGDKLPSEKELTEIFQVSRQTVRDAIKILTASNLIETRAGATGGHFVAQISYEDMTNNFSDFISLSLGLKGISLQEVAEIRKTIEIEASILAAKRRTDEDLTKLQSILSQMEDASDVKYFDLDFEFHKLLAYASKNRMIILTVEAINIALKPLFQATNNPTQLKEELTEELQEIYTAIEKQDSDLAKKAMFKHLQHFEGHFQDEIITKIKEKQL